MVKIQETFYYMWHRWLFSILSEGQNFQTQLFWNGAVQCWYSGLMWDPGSFWGPLAGSPGTCWVFSFSSHCLKTCSTGELEELLPVLFQLFYMPASLQTGTSLCVATLNLVRFCRFHILWSFSLISHEHKAHTETVPLGPDSTQAFGALQMSAGHPLFLGVVTMTTRHLTAAAHNGMLWCDRDDPEVPLADRWTPALEDKSSEMWAEAKNGRLMEDVRRWNKEIS